MFLIDVLVVLLQPGVSWIACLSNVDLTTFTENAAYPQCLLDQLMKIRDFPWLMFCQKSTLLMWLNMKPDIRQEGDWVFLVFGLGNHQWRVEGPATLPVPVVILPENVPQNTNPTRGCLHYTELQPCTSVEIQCIYCMGGDENKSLGKCWYG